MIELKDRVPLKNGKNNRIVFTIPDTVTNADQLLALLRSGCYADVLVNNQLTGPDVGVESIGIPITKGVFESIDEEDGNSSNLDDLAMVSDSAPVYAGWTRVNFPRGFIFPPAVTACVKGSDDLALKAIISSVDNDGFYAGIVYSKHTYVSGSSSSISYVNGTDTFVTGSIEYIAVLDLGVGK